MLTMSFKSYFWRIPRVILIPLLRVRFRNKFKRPTKIYLENQYLKLIETPVSPGKISTIYFYFPMRLPRYFVGIQERLDILAREYCLDQIEKFESGVIVDIGSNIGEFTLAANQLFPNCEYVRFEPSSTECRASQLNLANVSNVLIEKPLWSEIVVIPFFDQNQSGDSSLFKPTSEAKATLRETATIDDEIRKLGITSIEILKLEAEGAEPEILKGAPLTLKFVKRVTADLGPERGLAQSRTFDEVNQILVDAGFRLSGKNPGGRECYLYTRD